MPELPEVEVVRLGLQRHAAGRTVTAVDVLHPRSVRRHPAGSADLAARLTGCRLEHASRRGKYLWVPLGAGGAADRPAAEVAFEALVAHLGMSGQLLVVPAGVADEAHLRVRLVLDDGHELRFVDQRTFGGVAVETLMPDRAGGHLPASVVHIARDPLDPLFDAPAFARAVRRRHTGVKRALLDQTLVSGIGNIYADEALWRAGLHYARPTDTLTGTEVGRVLAAVRAVMTDALAEGGTSFDALYVDVTGAAGYFERSLQVYGRGGLPCSRCGRPIRRDRFMNRSAFTCPGCQPRPRRAHW